VTRALQFHSDRGRQAALEFVRKNAAVIERIGRALDKYGKLTGEDIADIVDGDLVVAAPARLDLWREREAHRQGILRAYERRERAEAERIEGIRRAYRRREAAAEPEEEAGAPVTPTGQSYFRRPATMTISASEAVRGLPAGFRPLAAAEEASLGRSDGHRFAISARGNLVLRP